MLKRVLSLLLVFFTLSFLAPDVSEAQCPMCKLSAESNLKNGGTAGKGLNSGILYLFAAPYLLLGMIGYVYWKKHKNQGKDRMLEQEYDSE